MFDKLFGYGSMTESKAIIEESRARESKLREIASEISDLGARREYMSMDKYYQEYFELLGQLEKIFD